jgi:hypothetical protein
VAHLEGSCHCGAVRFEVTEEFIRVSQCHCTTCKKLSGGVGTTNGRARTEWIRILAGQDELRTYQPAEGTAKTFCSRCGSNLFGGGWPESQHTSVRISAIDTYFDQKPGAHIYVRSIAPWETLPDDGAERFDTTAAAEPPGR